MTAVCLSQQAVHSSLTKQAKVSDLLQRPPQVAAGLEPSPVGVDVHVANGLLDPDAEAQ